MTTQRETVRIVETGERVPMTSPDQVIVHGQLEGGAVAVHLRGGRLPGTGFLLEVTGTDGMLVVEGAGPFAMVLSELTLAGARGEAAELTSMEVPERYRRGCGYGRNDREQIADLLRELRAAADLVAGARRG